MVIPDAITFSEMRQSIDEIMTIQNHYLFIFAFFH